MIKCHTHRNLKAGLSSDRQVNVINEPCQHCDGVMRIDLWRQAQPVTVNNEASHRMKQAADASIITGARWRDSPVVDVVKTVLCHLVLALATTTVDGDTQYGEFTASQIKRVQRSEINSVTTN